MSTRRSMPAFASLTWLTVGMLILLDVAWWWASGATLGTGSIVFTAVRWLVLAAAAMVATRYAGELDAAVQHELAAHKATTDQLEQLQVHNGVLHVLVRSVDVPLALQTLAGRISRLVMCDRIGLALLTETEEFQTYTARVSERERRSRPRPEVVFKAEGTAIGAAARSREPMLINDTETAAPNFLDIHVLHTSGFGSALVIPLLAEDRTVGTLNVVGRAKGAFAKEHADVLQPITRMLAVAYVTQQVLSKATRQEMLHAMDEATVGVASEINSALRTIVAQCELLEHEHPDAPLQRELATIVRQAQKITTLLERMRQSAG